MLSHSEIFSVVSQSHGWWVDSTVNNACVGLVEVSVEIEARNARSGDIGRGVAESSSPGQETRSILESG